MPYRLGQKSGNGAAKYQRLELFVLKVLPYKVFLG